MRTARLTWVAVWLLVVTGCGDDAANDGTPAGPGGGGAAADNQPPVIEPVAGIALAEGRSTTQPLAAADPDGDAVTFTLAPPEGVEAELTEGDVALLHAHVGAAGGELTITATDGGGLAATSAVPLTVTPLAWTETIAWDDGDGPEAREHASVLVDDASGSLYVMFGSGYAPYLEPLGDAWRFDVATRTWSEVSLEGDVPPPGGSRRLAGVRGSGEGILHGGYGEGQQVFGELYRVVAAGDVVTFEEIPQENPPGPRLLHVFAHDPGTDTYVLFGGAYTRLEGDTWTMRIEDGTARWTEVFPTSTLATPGRPAARYGAFHGMDEERGRLLVFSGQTSQTTFGEDTWVLDLRAAGGPTWSELALPGTPPGRRNGTSVWDPSGPRLFVFGGTSDGATTQPGLFALDARPGKEGWSRIDRDGEPELRSSGFGAFVADGEDDGAAWLGFGNDDAVHRDLSRLGY